MIIIDAALALLETLGPIVRVLDPCFSLHLWLLDCPSFLPRVLGKHTRRGSFWAGAWSVGRVWFLKVRHHGYHWEGQWPGRGEPERLGHDRWGVLAGVRRDCHHQLGESPILLPFTVQLFIMEILK